MRQYRSEATKNESLEVTLAVEGWNWHVVAPPADGGAAGALPSSQIPEWAEGVLLLSGASFPQPKLVHLVQSISSWNSSLPVIVMLLDQPSDAADIDALLEAQRDFQAAGAADVISKPKGGASALQVALRMSMQRAERSLAEKEFLQQRIAQLRKQLERAQAHLNGATTEETSDLLWKSAHELFEGFPQLDLCGARKGSSGPLIGPCMLDQKLGGGAFGHVYASTNAQTGAREAVKLVDKHRLSDLKDVRQLVREVTILAKLGHPAVVRLMGVLHTSQQICIRMEMAGRRDLARFIMVDAGGRLPLGDVRAVASQVAGALAHCHAAGVAHRDVKPENVTVGDLDVVGSVASAKLIDFGMAIEVSQAASERQALGTLPFTPPEVLKAHEPEALWNPDGDPDPRAGDVWSHGILVLETACGLGEFNRMLNWPVGLQPSAKLAADLAEFFNSGNGALAAALADSAAELRPEEAAALQELLARQLVIDPSSRCPASEVEEWFSRTRSA